MKRPYPIAEIAGTFALIVIISAVVIPAWFDASIKEKQKVEEVVVVVAIQNKTNNIPQINVGDLVVVSGVNLTSVVNNINFSFMNKIESYEIITDKGTKVNGVKIEIVKKVETQ